MKTLYGRNIQQENMYPGYDSKSAVTEGTTAKCIKTMLLVGSVHHNCIMVRENPSPFTIEYHVLDKGTGEIIIKYWIE